jgi:hypothetical protein
MQKRSVNFVVLPAQMEAEVFTAPFSLNNKVDLTSASIARFRPMEWVRNGDRFFQN